MPTSMLGISARMAAGKTTVTTRLAGELAAVRISFGRTVLEEVEARGVPVTRENLQDVGEELVQADVRGFCERVLSRNGWCPGDSIVVDGVRHVKVLLTLREIVEPKYFGLMYLNVDRETQRQRWQREDLAYSKSLEELERHPTEVEVLSSLPDFADLVLDGKCPVERVVHDIIQWSRSNAILGDWEARNERRIQLIERSVSGALQSDEGDELTLLQSSFVQYLTIKHNPYLTTDNTHQARLEKLEARLRSSAH